MKNFILFIALFMVSVTSFAAAPKNQASTEGPIRGPAAEGVEIKTMAEGRGRAGTLIRVVDTEKQVVCYWVANTRVDERPALQCVKM
ncbi:MAG: hypothetical protein V4736_06700 [Bdellovibrionota bacterium]